MTKRQKILEAFDPSLTQAQIAERAGASISYVCNTLADAGLEARSAHEDRPQRPPTAKMLKVVRLRKSGLSFTEVAKAVPMPRGTVSCYVYLARERGLLV